MQWTQAISVASINLLVYECESFHNARFQDWRQALGPVMLRRLWSSHPIGIKFLATSSWFQSQSAGDLYHEQFLCSPWIVVSWLEDMYLGSQRDKEIREWVDFYSTHFQCHLDQIASIKNVLHYKYLEIHIHTHTHLIPSLPALNMLRFIWQHISWL